MSTSRISLCVLFFGLFIAVYAAVLLVSPRVGADNEYHFLRTLQSGKPLIESSENFPYADTTGTSGRYMPLVSMEYNLVGLFSDSPHPFWYFLYHALQLAVFALLFVKLLGKAGLQNKKFIFALVALLLLIPASTLGWFRLQNQERNVLFFFAAFLLAYFSFSEKRTWWSFLLVLLTANIAIYYKEISFLSLGVFALGHLLFTGLKRKVVAMSGVVLNVSLMLSAALYLLLYYLIVYTQSSLTYLPSTFTLLSRLKVFANYAFFSDSLLILILIPLTLSRLWKIFVRKAAPEPLWDAALLGASAYVGAFFVLNAYSPYYLLPAYALALPSLFHFLRAYTPKTLPFFFKAAFGVTLFCLVFNAIPSGLYYLTYNKYYPVNFNKTADFLVKDITRRSAENTDDRPSVFFHAHDENSIGLQGDYFILYDNLAFRGLNDGAYDLKSDIETTTDVLDFLKIKPPHTVFSKAPASAPQSGDYLVVTPKSIVPVDGKLIAELEKDYTLAFATKSPLMFPNVNLKTIVKYAMRDKNIIANRNIFVTPDHYVFIKR